MNHLISSQLRIIQLSHLNLSLKLKKNFFYFYWLTAFYSLIDKHYEQGLLTSFSSFQHAMELHSDYSVVTSHAMKFSKNNKYIYPSILFLSSILLGAFTWTLFFVSPTELFHLKVDSRVAPFLCGVRNNEQGLWYLPISGYTYTNILHLNGAKKKKKEINFHHFQQSILLKLTSSHL